MNELRAALAIAAKDLRTLSRYPLFAASFIFMPLYQGLIPAFLFGRTFAVGDRVVGLENSSGTGELAGFLFVGTIVSGLVFTTFWNLAMSLRVEMDAGTLEPSWLTPTRRETFVLGRALASLAVLAVTQPLLLAIGVWFFGARLDAGLAYALPALAIAAVAMVGVAYLLAAAVLLMKEANFFVDATSFLFSAGSGVTFPVSVLPGELQALAYALPTTYAVDLLRQRALGTRPLLPEPLEYAAMLALAILLLPLGRWAFARAECAMRVNGTLAQH